MSIWEICLYIYINAIYNNEVETNDIREAGDEDGVTGEFAHIGEAEFPDLRGDAVLLHQRLLGKVELEGVVCGKADVQSSWQKINQGITMVLQK